MGEGVAYVEVYLNLTGLGWTDITSYVRIASGITITQGRADEASQAGPATCKFSVDNRDGRFSPTYPGGAWYGKIGRNTEVKVLSVHPDGVTPAARFFGYIDDLPMRWDQSGNDKSVQVSASSITRRLLKTTATYSPLKSYILSPEVGSTAYPKAYWPMEGAMGYGSTYAPAVGTSLLKVRSGVVDDASYTGFEGSGALPVFGANATMLGTLPSQGGLLLGSVRVYRQAMHFPSSGIADGTSVCEILFSGSASKWGIRYRTGGGLSIYAYNGATELIGDTNHAWSLDDARCVVYMVITMTASITIGWVLGVRKYSAIGEETVLEASGTVASQNVGSPKTLTIPPISLTGAAIGHACYGTSTTMWPTGLAPVGYPGELAYERIERLATQVGTGLVSDGVSTQSETLGPQTSLSPIQAARDAAAADGGILVDSNQQQGWEFYNQRLLPQRARATALTLIQASGHLAAPPETSIDDQGVVTEVNLTNTMGDAARWEVTSTEPVATTSTLNVHGPIRLQAAAEWLTYLGTTTGLRIPSLSIDLRRNTSLIPAWLDLRFGDRVRMLPSDQFFNAGVNGTTETYMSFIAQGWTEYISEYDWRVDLNLSAGKPWVEIGAIGNAETLRLDTDGATVASPGYNTTATAISVATTNTSSPLLSTSAADYPCYVIASTGELLQVTAVSGSASPQTVTVVRSRNGVVKTLPIGTTLKLWQPFRVAR